MTENTITTDVGAGDWPNYPGFGSPEDVLVRIHLLDWIKEQIGNGNVQANVGDYILATEGRILGVGRDRDELDRRVNETDPSMLNARVVGYQVPFTEY